MLPVPPPPSLADTARFTEHVLETALGPRRYRLYVPGGAGGGGDHPAPFVVVLHGCTQDAADIARGTRFNEHAERQGFIVAYPEQPVSANPQKCWNWFDPDHQTRDRGEPAVVAAIAREVMARHRVDPDRVHLAGISAGGAMAVIVALAYPDLFASVAVHSGIPYGAASGVQEALTAMRAGGPDPAAGMRTALSAMASRARALPALVIQGAEDPTVRVENGHRVAAQFVALAVATGRLPATPKPEEERFEDGARGVTRVSWRDPAGGVVVETWIVSGLAHAWSGGSPDGSWTDPAGPNATAAMVRFFAEHPLQP
jgi:poly(hydroxyalkanoate) depolymerase family esterase